VTEPNRAWSVLSDRRRVSLAATRSGRLPSGWRSSATGGTVTSSSGARRRRPRTGRWRPPS